MFSGAAHAACGTLATGGYRVTTPPEQGCCGALHAHNGDLDGARAARRLDGALVRRQRGAGRDDRRRLRSLHGRLRHAARHARGARPSGRACATTRRCSPAARCRRCHGAPMRVAYQDSCHLRNGQKVTLEPRALLASLPGVEVVDLPSAGRCCGAAGTYALMRPDDSAALPRREARRDRGGGRRRRSSAAIPGCLLQFRQGVQRAELAGRARAAHGGARGRAHAAMTRRARVAFQSEYWASLRVPPRARAAVATTRAVATSSRRRSS